MDLAQHIRDQLAAGPRSRAALQRGTGASQATLSRALRGLPEVRRIGAGPATRYVRARPLHDIGPDLPIYRVTRDGRVEAVGEISVADGGYVVDTGSGGAWHDGLPWFMGDMVPQGFLGRRFPDTYPELGLPERLSDWSDHHALYAIAQRGDDLPGNLIVGEASMQRWYGRAGQADVWTTIGADPVPAYRAMAARVLEGEIPGSSAAGERPKFTARVGEGEHAVHTLVKFSPPVSEPHGRRWSDLLVAEHLAAETVAAAGLPAARTAVYLADDRTFLEVERFDRVGERGRLGMVSIGAMDNAFLGHGGSWPAVAAELSSQGLIHEEAVERITLIHAFGQWIANTDMHPGNLAFLHEGDFPLALAPVYDMLPMRYAPRSDEVVRVPPQTPVPDRHTQTVWEAARALARGFWERVRQDSRISEDFQAVAAAQLRLC